MEYETEILVLGVVVGWLFSILVFSFLGVILGVNQFILSAVVGISAGILAIIFLIVKLVFFFKTFEIVRREK